MGFERRLAHACTRQVPTVSRTEPSSIAVPYSEKTRMGFGVLPIPLPPKPLRGIQGVNLISGRKEIRICWRSSIFSLLDPYDQFRCFDTQGEQQNSSCICQVHVKFGLALLHLQIALVALHKYYWTIMIMISSQPDQKLGHVIAMPTQT